MTEFSPTGAFQLVRRIAVAGLGNPSMYLLLCEEEFRSVIEKDLVAEFEVQLGVSPRIIAGSEIERSEVETRAWLVNETPVILSMAEWSASIVKAMDLNVVFLEKALPTFLLLATGRLGERIFAAAPNFANRLTDVLQIRPE